MRLIIAAAVLGGIILAVYWTRSTSEEKPQPVHAQPDQAQSRAQAPTAPKRPFIPRVHYSSEVPAPPVVVNRIPDDSLDYKQRAQLVSKWDEWISSAGVTADQQAKVLAILANAKANYDAALKEAEDLGADRDAEDAFVDLVSGLHLEDEIEADLHDVLTAEQLRVWKTKLGMVALLFSPNLHFLAPASHLASN